MHVAVDTPRPTHLINDKKYYFRQIYFQIQVYLSFWKNLCKYKSGLCAHGCPQGCGLGFYSDKNDSVAISPFDHSLLNLCRRQITSKSPSMFVYLNMHFSASHLVLNRMHTEIILFN